MAKFALKADPTFVASVDFPIAGGESVPVKVTFKHRTKTQLDEYVKAVVGRSDVDNVMDIVIGWDLEDEFTRDNVETLLENRIGVAMALYRAYRDELIQARTKNSA